MIVSAGYRTDIPAFYGQWFMNRMDSGYCEVRNPFNGRINNVSLRPKNIDGLIFWTKIFGPFLNSLQEIYRRAVPFTVQYTITGYPTALERSVPGSD